MKIIRYTSEMNRFWDDFVDNSKNGTFLFRRDYMEYHIDRFPDHSYIFFNDSNKIIALLPATRRDDVLSSHGGLTYGGLVLDNKCSAVDVLEMFSLLREELRREGIAKLVYKTVPHIYHRQGSEEDLYALFRNDARLSVRNLATVINLREPIHSSRLGKRAESRQRKAGIIINEVDIADSFWNIVIENLRSRHNTRPVHTAAELNYLKSRFPENIRFYTAEMQSGEVIGGVVIYLNRNVIHLQYVACSPKGKELFAADMIYHDLVYNRLSSGFDYFDFGISNEDAGRYLNEGLVSHKEVFGGRSVVYDTYEMDV